MVVWRICGNEVGPNGNGAAHFATKAEALAAKREADGATGPDKIIIRDRKQLADELNAAMGYGCS